jgi:hypothetical protein
MTTSSRPNIIFISAEQQCLDWLYTNTFKHRDLFVEAR